MIRIRIVNNDSTARASGVGPVTRTPKESAHGYGLHLSLADPAPFRAAGEGGDLHRRARRAHRRRDHDRHRAQRGAARDHGRAARQGARRGAGRGTGRAAGRDAWCGSTTAPSSPTTAASCEVTGRREIRTNQDVRDVYTPGVARVCEAIAEFPQLAGRFTMIGRSVAICTNGTRVLGLGRHRPGAEHAGHGGQGAVLRPARRRQRGADPHRHQGRRRVRRHRDPDRPRLRRDPPRGHLRARVLRDRAPADRGPAPAGDARRRPRHRGRHHGRRDRGLPPGGHAPRRGRRRPDRPGRGGLRDRLAHPRRRGQAGHRHRPQPVGAGAGARTRDRDRGPCRPSCARPTWSSPPPAGPA